MSTLYKMGGMKYEKAVICNFDNHFGYHDVLHLRPLHKRGVELRRQVPHKE